MKRLLIIFLLSTASLSYSLEGVATSVKGGATINNKKINKEDTLFFSRNDTLKTVQGTTLNILMDNGIKLFIKDSTLITLNDLYFKLKFGFIRFKIPDTIRQNSQLIIESQDIVTSVLNGGGTADFAFSSHEDTTFVALYQGDSLMFQPLKQGDKSLNQIYYLEEFKSMAFHQGDIIQNNESVPDYLSLDNWLDKLEYAEYLMTNLEIDEARKILLEALISDKTRNLTYKNKTLYYLAYISSFDNQKEEASNYLGRILSSTPDYSIPSDFQSPKISEWYDHVKDKMNKSNGHGTNFLLYSLVPGAYQLKANKKMKGVALLGVNTILWGGFFYHGNRQNHFEDLSGSSRDRVQAQNYYKKATDHYDKKNIFFYAALGSYVINWFDAFYLRNQIRLRTEYENNRIRLSLHYRF